MKNLYFKENDPLCHSEADIREYMTENNITEIQVFKAKRELRTGYFFCKLHQEMGLTAQYCGKQFCDDYIPNNGKNGRCKYYGYDYRKTNEKKLIFTKPL